MEKNAQKNMARAAAAFLIIFAIWYLEASKPKPAATAAPDVTEAAGAAPAASSTPSRAGILAAKSAAYSKAKELVDPQGFINSPPFTLSDFVGKKVILLDFWTYSCINCLRTVPYLRAWYEKYHDKGLEIIGIHTPEFDFEKKYDNVAAAVKRENIEYPVVLDSNRATWSAYQNQYWPREYLIDIDGYVVHDHIGEGSYDETEAAIQKTLAERDAVLGLSDSVGAGISSPSDAVSMDSSRVQSPETYFGSDRNDYLANGAAGVVGPQTLVLPQTFRLNALYLSGAWNFQNQFAETVSAGAKIVFRYSAKNVYLVASAAHGATIRILQDGVPLSAEAGADVGSDSAALIRENRLYKIVQNKDYGEHTLEIDIENAGLDAFTFTFG